MSDDMKRKISEHPCYSPEAQHKFGRLHLAVAPSCNIQCNYCDRKFDCVNESRPGVTSEVLSPQEALERTTRILEQNPYISVIGIAGPGDPLDNDETFETFRLIREKFPEITLCISTNGLLLPDRFDELLESNVETLTVTMNAFDPEIQKEIISMVYYGGKKYEGREAAELLIQKQLEGIEKAVEAGMTVKINTVLIPGINDKHIVDLAKKMNELGVYIMNVMPLINQAAFADIVPPTDQERKVIQDACAPYVKQMRHCRQCRSDAYGLIGKDLSVEKQPRKKEFKPITISKNDEKN
ncbi:nitrogenase cofactor biosynthesis protein NifB [Methanimicrococcus blatticola]|nr:nitrogenase cofactor biosynthesis protein NifB [Methanimicrococcus blatticola]MBZ3935079.1 nitrogenase cofactor biosynthesis protein NifB [Methanimicrococcus blatticola]MCC2508824.1 nitrogenase cofactor biosynthesis protein NifB [Methanimicrococcus blatticola]